MTREKELPDSIQKARPFLKWAGGKGQLLSQIDSHLPAEIRLGKIKRYVEPFTGSGALFFHIAQTYPIEEFILADLNSDLILTYQVVQKDVEALIGTLEGYARDYLALDESGRERFYYRIRDRFNRERFELDYGRYSQGWIRRAAEVIFLNKTGYNGLFRTNSKGEFNVPIGRYKSPRILDAQNLRAASRLLEKARFQFGDFESIEAWVDPQTLVYFDPPYRPISSTAHFRSYSMARFDDPQQLRLAEFYRRLDSRGVRLMLSNSDPQSIDPEDDFFEQAYAGFRILRVYARRNINSVSSRRGSVSELLILNY